MDTNTYTILMEKREDMEKKLRRLEKKAQKYGIPFATAYGEPYVVEITHKDDFGEKYTQKYEVFDLTIESETIKKDGYTVLAHIEHSPTGNIVNTFNCDVQKDWIHLAPFCDHCNSNHNLKYTFIVSDGAETKQVGRTCLKDYCGIDPQFVGMMNEFHDEIDEYTADGYDFREPLPCVFDSMNVLALAIKVEKEQGYIKSDECNSNKSKISKEIGFFHDSEYYAQAEKMANAIAEMPIDDAIDSYLNNVQARINGFYCKPSDFGYFAYAPVAFEKYMKKIEAKKRKEKENNEMAMQSDYVGTVGERMTIDVKEMKLITSFFTNYGTTFLYRFIDHNNNVFIWFSSGSFTDKDYKDITEVAQIKATIKAHSERDGVKQTILTRVKKVK